MPQSRNRGIGRYSMALAKAMLRHARGHDVLVALNGMYADTVGETRAQFDGLIAPDRLKVWHSALPAREPRNPEERRAMQLVRESFFASLGADVVHVLS